jgi:hypothetical protein
MHQLRPYRLQNERGGTGLSCDENGIALAGIELLLRTADGFVPRPIGALDALLKGAYSDTAPLMPNNVHIDNPRFQSADADTGNVPSVVREFVASGLASQIWRRGEGDGREISGNVRREGDSFAVEDARWGIEASSGVRIPLTADKTPVPTSEIPFYFHTHSDVSDVGAGEVYPGPSKVDVKNSHDHGIW